MTQKTATYCVAILTASDGVTHGVRQDVSGDILQEMVEAVGAVVTARRVVQDEVADIAQALRDLCARNDVDCIITTGGTGIGPRDVTPEATESVIEKSLPGMAEAMRAESLKKTKFAMLSRQVVGVAKGKLIVNLPGSPKAVKECLAVILPVIPHAIQLLCGHTEHVAEGDSRRPDFRAP